MKISMEQITDSNRVLIITNIGSDDRPPKAGAAEPLLKLSHFSYGAAKGTQMLQI